MLGLGDTFREEDRQLDSGDTRPSALPVLRPCPAGECPPPAAARLAAGQEVSRLLALLAEGQTLAACGSKQANIPSQQEH